MYSLNSEYERINKLINSMPNTQAEYDDFLKNADPEAIQMYNKCLADVKLNDEISDELLQKYGFNSNEEFWSRLDLLYSQGCDGDIVAQNNFNELMNSYQNDFFQQANDIASQNFFEEFSNLNMPGNFTPSFLDLHNMPNFKTFAMGIFSFSALYICLNSVYKRTEFAQNRVAKKQEKREAKKENQKLLTKLKKHKDSASKKIEEEDLQSLKKINEKN